MDPINEVHVSRPGLVLVDVAAADDATALAFQEALARIWATAPADRTNRTPADRTNRTPGEPGVRLRCYLDLRQPISLPTVPGDAVPEVSTAAPR
ncbi:DUF6207 family protein [Streptomyces mirabilis]|uniref:DUF6207 family protein n=1 Tax=Streptomyces mirabilis TaxID=68239 RepID=UPI0033321671